MRYSTDIDILLRCWLAIAAACILGGLAGVVADIIVGTLPAFTIFCASATGVWEFLAASAWRSQATRYSFMLARATGRRWRGEGHVVMPSDPEDTQPVKVHNWQSTSQASWHDLDLARACGDPIAANKFEVAVKRDPDHPLQVEYWKAYRGVGRPKFVLMRNELEACGHVVKGASAYEWTEKGREWLRSI